MGAGRARSQPPYSSRGVERKGWFERYESKREIDTHKSIASLKQFLLAEAIYSEGHCYISTSFASAKEYK